MLFSKKPKKSKELPLEKEFLFYVYNMKNYYANYKDLGTPAEIYATKNLPKFGQNYYQYDFNNLTIGFTKPTNKSPMLVLCNGIPIGEVSLIDTPKVMQYLSRPCIIDYYFSGGNHLSMDFDGNIEKGFYAYYCSITLTLQ